MLKQSKQFFSCICHSIDAVALNGNVFNVSFSVLCL